MLADQIGASLLIEGVETEQDLQRAIAIGARFVQGYLFAPAEAEFRPADSFAPLIEESLEQRRLHMLQVERHWSNEAKQLRLAVETTWEGTLGDVGGDDFIERLLPGLVESACIRIYLCSNEGIQISSNFSATAKAGGCDNRSSRG